MFSLLYLIYIPHIADDRKVRKGKRMKTHSPFFIKTKNTKCFLHLNKQIEKNMTHILSFFSKTQNALVDTTLKGDIVHSKTVYICPIVFRIGISLTAFFLSGYMILSLINKWFFINCFYLVSLFSSAYCHSLSE